MAIAANEWMNDGLCGGSNQHLFFAPEQKESREVRAHREGAAKALCARCPVQTACLNYAMAAREHYGIWGGLTETERESLRSR